MLSVCYRREQLRPTCLLSTCVLSVLPVCVTDENSCDPRAYCPYVTCVTCVFTCVTCVCYRREQLRPTCLLSTCVLSVLAVCVTDENSCDPRAYCPPQCKCSGTEVRCSHQQLNALPELLPLDTTELYVTYSLSVWLTIYLFIYLITQIQLFITCFGFCLIFWKN